MIIARSGESFVQTCGGERDLHGYFEILTSTRGPITRTACDCNWTSGAVRHSPLERSYRKPWCGQVMMPFSISPSWIGKPRCAQAFCKQVTLAPLRDSRTFSPPMMVERTEPSGISDNQPAATQLPLSPNGLTNRTPLSSEP